MRWRQLACQTIILFLPGTLWTSRGTQDLEFWHFQRLLKLVLLQHSKPNICMGTCPHTTVHTVQISNTFCKNNKKKWNQQRSNSHLVVTDSLDEVLAIWVNWQTAPGLWKKKKKKKKTSPGQPLRQTNKHWTLAILYQALRNDLSLCLASHLSEKKKNDWENWNWKKTLWVIQRKCEKEIYSQTLNLQQ